MDSGMVAQVRRFNRIATQRAGALDDRFLDRARSLGASRVLWELGEDGCEVRALRSRLGLDSGYLSRMLRTLEAEGLVRVEPGVDDRRVRVARPTARGRRERAVVERRSQELACSVLEPLTSSQRDRLVAAMGEVEQLLTATLVVVTPADPATPAARHCLREYATELYRRFDSGFDPAVSTLPDPDVLRAPVGLLLVASLHGEPVGCGALRFHAGEPPDIKRMWVAEPVRGVGLGRRLLSELEARAVELGHDSVRLDTNRALGEAIAMYRAAGYKEVPAFNDEAHAHHWFAKQLG